MFVTKLVFHEWECFPQRESQEMSGAGFIAVSFIHGSSWDA